MAIMYTISLITTVMILMKNVSTPPPSSIQISQSHYFEKKISNSKISKVEKVSDAGLHDLCPLTSLTDIDSLSNLDLITLPIVAFMDEG